MKRQARPTAPARGSSHLPAKGSRQPAKTNSRKQSAHETASGGYHADTQISGVSAASTSTVTNVRVGEASDVAVVGRPQRGHAQVGAEPQGAQASTTDVVAVTRSHKAGVVDRWLVGPLILLCAIVVYALVAVRGNVDRLWDILHRIV